MSSSTGKNHFIVLLQPEILEKTEKSELFEKTDELEISEKTEESKEIQKEKEANENDDDKKISDRITSWMDSTKIPRISKQNVK